jgi:hypothetical protein
MPDSSGTAAPAPYTVAAYGYDDVSLGFDLNGSALAVRRVREMSGRVFGTTKRLGTKPVRAARQVKWTNVAIV